MAATRETRPVNLNLTAFRFPIAAIVSILHRISGIVVFIGVGYLTYLLSLTLESPESFNWVFYSVGSSFHGFLVWIVLSAILYHFIAGVRHLLLDFHIGMSLAASRKSSWTVLLLSLVASIALAVWMFA